MKDRNFFLTLFALSFSRSNDANCYFMNCPTWQGMEGCLFFFFLTATEELSP